MVASMTKKIPNCARMSSRMLQREILGIIAAWYTMSYLARLALSSCILKVSIKNNFSVSWLLRVVVKLGSVG